MKLATLCLVALALSAVPAAASQEDGSDSPPWPNYLAFPDTITPFVSRIYHHSVPYREAHALGPRALPQLTAMLEEERRKSHWQTIAATINYIGEPSSFPVLRSFMLNKFRGEIDSPTYSAMLAIIATMGPLAAASDSAFAFLASGTEPEFWSNLPWSNQHHEGRYLRLLLSGLAINSMALSGRQGAIPVLERLAKTPLDEAQRADIEQGLKTQREVEKVGRERYYDKLGRSMGNPW